MQSNYTSTVRQAPPVRHDLAVPRNDCASLLDLNFLMIRVRVLLEAPQVLA